MTHQHEHFTPQEADEQIDQLSQSLHVQKQPGVANQHLVRQLQRLFKPELALNVQSLERVRKRIARTSDR